jgi:hypothetical protein
MGCAFVPVCTIRSKVLDHKKTTALQQWLSGHLPDLAFA